METTHWRLTNKNVQKILDYNNGFVGTREFTSKYVNCTKVYKVIDGVSYGREYGKTVYGDFDREYVCDSYVARQFIRENMSDLNLESIDVD